MPSQQWSGHKSGSNYMTDDQLSVFVGNNTRMPTSQIEMTISCRNLINTDVLSKSDPFCIISMRESWQNKYFEIARTETIDDTLNPHWVRKVNLAYNFESIQKMRFEVNDEDVGDTDFLGAFETVIRILKIKLY